MITTDNDEYAAKMKRFRTHSIATDYHQRESAGSWIYDVVDVGYNYRLTDFQCALGLSQLRKIEQSVTRRRKIASLYDAAFADLPTVTPLTTLPEAFHSYHLYVILLEPGRLSVDRKQFFKAMRAENIGVNVHYIPVHLHTLYRERFGTGCGLCPTAEAAYDRMITIPMYPGMSDGDVKDVIAAVHKVSDAYSL